MTVGIITEKNSAAQNFSKALGGMRGTYDGTPYIIVASVGHLFEFVKPGEKKTLHSGYDEAKFKSWSSAYLPWDEKAFTWVRGYNSNVASKVKELKSTLSGCSEIVIATDIDSTGEGDLIGVEIIEELGLLNSPGKTFSRMYFVDEAPKSLRKAFTDRKSVPNVLDLPEYRKAYYRSRFDYLSMQWTRVATECSNGAMVRQGRLKTAMVQLVGDQLKAYNSWKRKPFYKSSFIDENKVRYHDKDAPMYEKREDVPMNFSNSPVELVSREMKRKAPPALMTLGRLSATLARKGYSADKVLKTYQSMYEAQILSYPRTDDKTITVEQFNEMAPLVDSIAKVVGADISKLTHRTARTTHVKDKGAHGANRPGTNVPTSLDEIENNPKFGTCGREIYELVARNFLAMFAEDYVYESQVGRVKDYPSYIGRASVPKEMGFYSIFPADEEDEKDEDETTLGLGRQATPEVYEGVPPRPAYPTQGWLEKALAKENIGTSATRTSTLVDVTKPQLKYKEKKADPNYVLLKSTKGKLLLGQLGEYSYALAPGTHIGDLKLSKQIFDNMDKVATGDADPDALLAGVAELVAHDIPIMQKNAAEMKKVLKMPEGSAPAEIVKGTWNGEEIGIKRNVYDHELTDDELQRAFAGETIEFEATSPKDGVKKSHRMSIQEFVYKGKTYKGLRYATAARSDAGVPLEFGGHTFTADELDRLGKGEKVKFGEVFTWKNGNKGSATLYFDQATKKLEFAKGVPDSFGQYTFTADEKARLEAGEEVAFGEVFTWRSGKKGSATLVYDADLGKLGFVNNKK